MSSTEPQSSNPYQVTPGCMVPPPPSSSVGRPRTSPMAIASLILGVTGLSGVLFCLPALLLSISAVVTGHLSQRELRRDPALTGRGMMIAGLVLGYLGSILVLLIASMVMWAIATDQGSPF